MRNVSKKLTVEVKHYRDPHNCKYVCLEVDDSLGKVRCSRSYMFDPCTGTWQYTEDGKLTEVTQEHVFRDFLNVYKLLMSIENLISDNLAAVEEGY